MFFAGAEDLDVEEFVELTAKKGERCLLLGDAQIPDSMPKWVLGSFEVPFAHGREA